MKQMKLLNLLIIVLSLVCLANLQSCSGQLNEKEACKSQLQEAKKSLNSYYYKKQESSLQESLNYAQRAMKCKETRRGAVELKISILILLKNYTIAADFVDSLTDGDFSAVYKRKMNHDFLHAKNY